MANWTDQTQQVFTQQDFDSKWGLRGGKAFCTLCNKDFQVGDKWRWVNASLHPTSFGNFQVCELCDGHAVLDRYKAACDLVYKSVKGRGQDHWPVDIAAKLIAAREQIEALEAEHNEVVTGISNLNGLIMYLQRQVKMNKEIADNQTFHAQRLQHMLDCIKADKATSERCGS